MATEEQKTGKRRDICAITSNGTLIARYYDISNIKYPNNNNPHLVTFVDKHGVGHQLVADVIHVITHPDRKTAPVEGLDYPSPSEDANPYL